MSDYLKPQSPLYHKDQDAYFYPLTTADQVIMEDDNRLNTFLDKVNDVLSTTTNDNGKFLRVVDGVPVWVTISNAEEVSV